MTISDSNISGIDSHSQPHSQSPSSHVLLVFLDGFGLGRADHTNPLYVYGLPRFEKHIGVKLRENTVVNKPGYLLKGIDACLGVDGIPQSATGQTSLLTGINAPKHLGYHLPAFPNPELVTLIQSKSILKQVTDLGLTATFANAYTDTYFEKAARRKYAHSVTTHCVLAANLPFRMTDDLRNNNAVYWDITRDHLDPLIEDINPVSPSEAGKHLAQITNTHAFTLYESFASDLCGHNADENESVRLLDKIDQLLDSTLASLNSNATLLVCSDHGNIEDLTTASHTVNKVPLIAIGPDAPFFTEVERIDQVTEAILRTFTETY
ncbi:MAG: phosphoglyceromutase [Fibrobacter sp.]|nr:phosphoglyceromutase [Fibrobacter sp.]